MAWKTIDDVGMAGKTVSTRVDINVPMEAGRVTDATRIEKIVPTIEDLIARGAKVVLLAHFGRPKRGKPVPGDEPAAGAAGAGGGAGAQGDLHGTPKPRRDRRLAAKCRGAGGKHPLHADGRGQRPRRWRRFWPGWADLFCNDAFSAAHRAHASTKGWRACCPPLPAG